MTDKQPELSQEVQESGAAEAITPTVGEILQQARTAAGLSVDDIAGRLHLRPTLVQDIEANRFDSITSATYARGYVRNFARIVGADERQVMACLEQQVPSEAEPAMQSFSRKTSVKAHDSRLTLVTWLIAIVLAALLVLWWVQKSDMSSTLDLSKPTVEEVAAAETNPSNNDLSNASNSVPVAAQITEPVARRASTSAQLPTSANVAAQQTAPIDEQLTQANQQTSDGGANEATPSSAISQPQAQSNVDNSPQIDNEPAAQSTSVTQDAASLNADLTLSLTGDCWMKIQDATGKVLVEGVKKPGREIKVTGTAPLSLVIGAPQVVNLSYNGENISLANYPSGKVARFTLPQN